MNNWLSTAAVVVITLTTFVSFVLLVIWLTMPDQQRQRIQSRRRRLARRYGTKLARLRRAAWSWIKWPLPATRWLISHPVNWMRAALKTDFLRGRFNPITWILFRVTVSVTAGLLVAGTVKLILWSMYRIGLIPVDPMTNWIFIAITALIALAIGRPETDMDGNAVVEVVPPTDYGALVTFFGMPTWFIRKSGEYGWIGRRLGFDRSRKPFTGVSMPGSDEEENENNPLNQGFIPLGDITFQVWNSPHAESKKEKTELTRPAKNRASVTGSLTLIGNFPRPRLWLKAVDPALDIGDRARQEYQELIETLVDTDVPAVQPMLEDYLLGKTILTAFLTKINKDVREHKQGAMIRDRSGLVMYHIVHNNESEEQACTTFVSRLEQHADPKMLKAIAYKGRQPDGSQGTLYAITPLKVSKPLHQATRERGLQMTRVTFGDITYTPEVAAAAAQASAESDERNAQIASAKTNREARAFYRPTPSELANREVYELTTVLQAAADNKTGNVRIVMVPGAGGIGSALVAAGQQVGERS